ncbi:MAG: hypothetical protein JWO55_250 [Candidatus Saccharibacteria bacterium]|jgi:hypothetical protein|nr:hypothetical protein [Candidatus Saccharibacteria bacterium]
MDQRQPEAPAHQPPAEQVAPIAPAKNKRKILALWLLIGPTALIVGSLILFAIVNAILASTTPVSGEMFGGQSIIRSILNVILFLVGIVSVITWMPGIIAGIILLATQKKS